MTVFVSYARENQQKAESLAQDLRGLGQQVWFDQDLTGGQAWWDHLLTKIRECDTFVFALAPESLDSPACKLEYGYASKLGKRILPVLVADGVSMELLPSALAQIQYVDYRREDKDALKALSRAFAFLPPPRPLPDPLPEAPAAPVSYLGSLKEQLEVVSLSFDAQTGLLLRLKHGLREAKDTEHVRILLKQFQSRPDLYARIASEIDALLTEDQAASRARPVEPGGATVRSPDRPTQAETAQANGATPQRPPSRPQVESRVARSAPDRQDKSRVSDFPPKTGLRIGGFIAVASVVGLVVAFWKPSETGTPRESKQVDAVTTQPEPGPEQKATPPVYKGEPITLRAQNSFPVNSLQTVAFLSLANALDKSSPAPVRLEALPAGAVVPVYGAIDAVDKGTLDAAWVSPMFLYGKDTAFALIDGPPFGPRPARYVQWRGDRNVAKSVDTLYRSYGVKGILCDVRGPYADLWSRPVIGEPADLSGQKIRAIGIRAEIFSAAGAKVIALPAGEIYPALSRGVIDAIQYLDPASDIQLGFHEVTKNLYYPGNITPVAGYDLIINARKWDALPREAQSVLQEACKRNVQNALNSNAAAQQAHLASLASKKRVRVTELPASVVSALRTAWQKVAEQKSSNPVFRELLESSRRFE